MNGIPLLMAVFIASLIGSLHCAGMCGPLVMLSVSSGRTGRPIIPILSYHAGRLLAYGFLGILAGSIGMGIHDLGFLAGMQRAAARIAGGAMVVSGALAILHLSTGRTHQLWLPKFGHRVLRGVSAFARRQSSGKKSFLLGILTACLPCGWLYAFVLAAVATASPIWGAGTMIAFALGGVPALSIIGLSGAKLQSSLVRFSPIIVALLVLVTGLNFLLFRSGGHVHTQEHSVHLASVHGKLPPVSGIGECLPEEERDQDRP